MKKLLVAYFRVSTRKQGLSGLGIEAQKAAVEAFAAQHGYRIVASYTEVESGKRKDRPELAKALGHAKLSKATLAVAKLDRLGRNVAFLSALMESRVDFVACDNPAANTLTLHVLAAVAEAEATAISQRTTASLNAAARRGVLIGSAREGHWEGREDRREVGRRKAVKAAAAARSEAVREAYAFLLPELKERRTAGATLEGLAAWLNDAGHLTRAGKPFTSTAVYRLLARA